MTWRALDALSADGKVPLTGVGILATAVRYKEDKRWGMAQIKRTEDDNVAGILYVQTQVDQVRF